MGVMMDKGCCLEEGDEFEKELGFVLVLRWLNVGVSGSFGGDDVGEKSLVIVYFR